MKTSSPARKPHFKVYLLTAVAVFFGVGLYRQWRDRDKAPVELPVVTVFAPGAAPGLDVSLGLCRDGGADYGHLVVYRLAGASPEAARKHPLYGGFLARRPFGKVWRYVDGCGLFAPKGKPVKLSPHGNNLLLVDEQKVYAVYLPEDCPVSACHDPAAPDGWRAEVFRERVLAAIRAQPQFAAWGAENPPAPGASSAAPATEAPAAPPAP